MAKAADVQRYGERWCEYVRQVAESVDLGRTRLAEYHPVVGSVIAASRVLSLAHEAMRDVTAAVAQRMTDYLYLGHARDGLAWRALEKRFFDACAEVRRVCATLDMEITLLFNDEKLLSDLVSETDTTRIADEHRTVLTIVQTEIHEKTRLYLDQAKTSFRAGRQMPAGATFSV